MKFDDIKNELMEAGIQESYIKAFKTNYEPKLTVKGKEKVDEIFKTIIEIIKKIEVIKAGVPKYVWDNYKLIGIKNLTEIKILNDYRFVLRELWKKVRKEVEADKKRIKEGKSD